MALGAVIGALRVNLGLDSAQFRRGLQDSEGGMQRFAKAATVAFAAVAAAGAAAFVGVQRSAQQAEQTMRQSMVAGAGFEEFQRLAHGAKLYGIEADKLSDIYKDMNDRIGDFVQTGGGPMADFFENIAPKVGITAESFERLSGPQALQLFYDSLERANLSQAEMTFYMEAMASDATALIPLLRNGGAAFREMGEDAEYLGLVMSERTALGAIALNENINRLGYAMQGFWNQVLANVIGGLVQLTDRMVAAAQQSGFLDMAVTAVSYAMNALVRALSVVMDNFELLIGIVRTFIAIKIVLFLGSTATAMVAFARTVRVTGLTIAAVTKLIGGKVQALILLAAVIAEVTGATQTLVGWLEQTGQAVYSALPEGMRQSLDGVADMFTSIGGSIEDVSTLTADMFGTAYTGADMAANGFERINSAASGAATGVDTAKDAVDKLGVSAEQVTSTLANGFTDLFTSALDGSKSLMQSIGDLLKQLGTMFLNAGFQALLGMGGGGIFSGIGNFFSGLFGGGRAAGGPVSAGTTYLVGEKGPELFSPSTSGHIVPNHKLGERRPTQISLVVQEGSLFEATVRRISGEGDVQVARTIERNFGGMMADYNQRNG